MKTRTRNAIALGVAAALMTAGLVWAARQRSTLDPRAKALDAIPNGALLIASADLDAIRKVPSFASLLREGRDIPGLGKVSDVCGFDPMDTLHEIAVAIPAAGDEGEFGVVAVGEVDDDALVACASKVIEARGGRAAVTPVGSFKSVRDATLAASGGEIAVRKGGPVLLGAGPYLRAMIDAADGRTPTIRSSVAHTHLAREIEHAALRVTVVLTPEQRRTLETELSGRAGARGAGGASGEGGASASPPPAPGSAVVAGALGVEIVGVASPNLAMHALLVCETEPACALIARSLARARDERASDVATRAIGIGAALEQIQIQAEGEQIHARLSLPAADAITLADRIITLRGVRRPTPSGPADPAPRTSADPAPSASSDPAPRASSDPAPPR